MASYDISFYLLYKCGITPHFSSHWSYSRLCCLAEVWSLCFPVPLWHGVNDVVFLLPFTCHISLITTFHWVGALFSSVFMWCPVHGSPATASKHYCNIMQINNMKMLLWKNPLKLSLLCFPETEHKLLCTVPFNCIHRLHDSLCCEFLIPIIMTTTSLILSIRMNRNVWHFHPGFQVESLCVHCLALSWQCCFM